MIPGCAGSDRLSGILCHYLVPLSVTLIRHRNLTSIHRAHRARLHPTDTTPLDGAYYEPDGGRAAVAVLLFHGNTMNFYVGAPRFLPPVLTRLGLACLAFNRRGHDILSTRNSRLAQGGAFQSTGEAIADNRIAADWLVARGFPHPVVIGHSNGGMLGVRHVVDHPQTPALVLLSAGRGGMRTVSGGKEGLFAGDRQDELTAQARALVAAGRGRELMFMPGWWYVITGELLDRIATVRIHRAGRSKSAPCFAYARQPKTADAIPRGIPGGRGGPASSRSGACDHFS